MKARLEGRVTARFESILFLTLNRNVCLFQKRQEKTSGTLYSVFKEPDPRGRCPADDAVPPAYGNLESRLKTETSVYPLT